MLGCSIPSSKDLLEDLSAKSLTSCLKADLGLYRADSGPSPPCHCRPAPFWGSWKLSVGVVALYSNKLIELVLCRRVHVVRQIKLFAQQREIPERKRPNQPCKSLQAGTTGLGHHRVERLGVLTRKRIPRKLRSLTTSEAARSADASGA